MLKCKNNDWQVYFEKLLIQDVVLHSLCKLIPYNAYSWFLWTSSKPLRYKSCPYLTRRVKSLLASFSMMWFRNKKRQRERKKGISSSHLELSYPVYPGVTRRRLESDMQGKHTEVSGYNWKIRASFSC